MENRKISAAYVALPEGLVRNCIVEVNSEGVITNVEREVKDLDARSGVEYYGGILIPGLINCHCHLEYSYVKGMIAKGGGMPKFISSIINIKYNRPIAEKEKIEMAALWDDVMYKNGITAVGDHNNNDYVTDIKLKSKIFYRTFIELYDADNQEAAQTFADGEKRAADQRALGLSTSVVPHATYTLADDLVALIGDEKNKGIISTHFKETVELGGENEADRMIDLISEKHDRILFVHSIYATDEQIKKAKAKYGDRLIVVPCPLSNIYIE
ncbi:MAG: amidohydrolase family protein, partial [Rikenellaceae bacterium]